MTILIAFAPLLAAVMCYGAVFVLAAAFEYQFDHDASRFKRRQKILITSLLLGTGAGGAILVGITSLPLGLGLLNLILLGLLGAAGTAAILVMAWGLWKLLEAAWKGWRML